MTDSKTVFLKRPDGALDPVKWQHCFKNPWEIFSCCMQFYW